MTKSKKILFGFLAAYLFAVLSLARAETSGPDQASQKWHSGQKWQSGQRIQEIYNQLNLTDDQKKQLEANKQRHRTTMQSARQEMKTYREALRQELMRSQLDTLKVNEIHNQIKSLQSQMEDEKLGSILAVRAILTPEQFSKFINLMHEHEQKEHEAQKRTL